ncbi:putative holin [Serratia sp. NPDC078593]|uniref:putative holin n=1 Tax=unclassified Serratia (in: enterobacteria) TaxID=2647522 RepID=UPI0037D70496
MPEPLAASTSAATYMLGGITIASLFAGGDTGVIIGSFSGAVIYVLSASDLSIWQRLLSFLASFLIGGQCAGFVTDVINYATPEVIQAERPLGAVVASAIAVRLFMYISKQSENPGQWFKKMRGNDGNGQ